uniref:Pleckstrin homology domain-containing family A member 5 n=2 Tax=Ficedula albicollis TaxID=59894 RepID=U3JE82_FICAL
MFSLPHRKLEHRCPWFIEMSRKKRKSCKSRKSSDSREYAQLSPICKCQQSVGSLENKAHEALSHFTEPLDVKGAEANGKDHENKNQSSSDASEERDLDNVSDSEKEGKKEKNYPREVFSPQQDEILATVTFSESEGSSKGKITLWGKPDSSDSISLATGKISAEVKYGSFNVKVEIKNISLFDSGTKVVDEKRKSSKNRKHHERQCQKSQCSKYSKYQCPSTDHSAEHRGKHKASTKHKIQTAINGSASLEMNIETKDIQVEYNSRKKNLNVSIKAGEQAQSKPLNKERRDTYWSETDYPVTEALYNTDCDSSFSFHEKEDYAFSDGYTLLPPPKEFADCDKMHLDTIVEGVSSYPVNSEKESDNLTTALSIWGEENCFCKLNTEDYEEHTNEKEDFSKDPILFSKINNSNCLVAINTLHNLNNGKECVSKRNLLGQEKNNRDKHRDAGPKTARRKSFPDTILDLPSPVHPRRDSGFYSLPSLNVLLKETKAGDVHNRNSHIPTKCKEIYKYPDLTSSLTELCKYSNLTSSMRNLRSLKSSYPYAFTSFDHNITIYPSEPEEDVSLDGTCLLNDYVDCVGQDEETEETLMESFHSSVTIHDKKENGHEETLGNLSVWKLESGSTEAVDKEKSEYNSIEKHTEWQNKPHLVQASPLSTSPLGEFISDKSTNYASTESIPKQCSVLQLNIHPPYADSEVTNKRRESVLTDPPVITGEVEGRLVQGNTTLIPECFGSAVKKEPNLTCSIQEESLLSSLLLDCKEHGMSKALESLAEVQNISGDVLVESDCHNNSAQPSLLSTSSLCTERKEKFTECSSIKQRLENCCKKQSIDDSLRREPGANQLSLLVKSNFEETESNFKVKEDYYENADISSSVKQISQKDLKSEMNKTRKLPLKNDTRASDSSQEDAIDQWARRRKQFKDSKKCSSTGGSSINSTITEGSINSEDARSVDLGLYSENEDRGFYTENFHSASWVFRGDDVSPDNSPRCLSKRPRPVAIRERTVKIAKGIGNYPWGFRIQFSKPILVTEVDTNSAAEEAGLQVGDILIAVNGTDVTSMPHSEAANLARKGPDILTMIVGSDISRYPNTPKPTCRGYLHKRTQSAILKGWRKRWFVLKHNGYLHYYKHKKDEGKCRPLEVTKLEGAEIGVDTSLGKPFVFKCIPQAGNRIFYFCATSNQEMKRWLEAMDKAVHPIHQNHVWVDVTLHNTTLPPLAIKNPECLGLLHQLDRSKDVWIQHYCILKDGCLYFYATLRSTPAQGGLYLQGYIVSEQSLGSKRSVIELRPPSEEFKTFYLCAENVNENKRWITALKASINKWLPLHQAIQDFMSRPLEETRM